MAAILLIFRFIFLSGSCCIFTRISFEFIPKSQFNYESAATVVPALQGLVMTVLKPEITN